MTPVQRLDALRKMLSRFKAHNEVYAREADKIMYDLFEGILNLHEDEQPSPESEPESPKDEIATSFDPAGDDTGPGGNHPEDPSGKP